MKRILLIGVATLGVVGQTWAQSVEIAPTRELINKVEMFPDVKEISNPEFHFRRIGPHVLWCVYADGGNGHFCSKVLDKIVTETDKQIIDFCKSNPNGSLYHALYGELWDLDYKCLGTRMDRLPLDAALDRDGYVRTQWRVLP
jgi:hypothetical protein